MGIGDSKRRYLKINYELSIHIVLSIMGKSFLNLLTFFPLSVKATQVILIIDIFENIDKLFKWLLRKPHKKSP